MSTVEHLYHLEFSLVFNNAKIVIPKSEYGGPLKERIIYTSLKICVCEKWKRDQETFPMALAGKAMPHHKVSG